jgi:hypothetical protein
MTQSVHFEIFTRRGSKGGWKLADARRGRDDAIAFAKELMGEDATGVKVVKETYNDETGDYLSLKIYEDGHNKMKLPPAQEDTPHALPCFKPDDLYSYHARKTIAKLIPDFLAHHRITVIELAHRTDMLEKLEASGTLLQHAIQKTAVAQAASSTVPVQQIIKSLLELTGKAFQRVYRDSRKDRFPKAKPGQFGALAEKLAAESDGRYLFNAALAAYLRDAAGWDEKVYRLIALMDEAGKDSHGAQLLLSSVDALIAEILSGSAALVELIGAKENFGAAIESLVRLFLGQEPDAAEAGQGLISLTQRFAADELPDSRGAIASRIIKEFRSNKRLCPKSLREEFMTLRRIANSLVTGVGKYLSHEDLVSAFVLRSKRLITHETLGEILKGMLTPDEKLERLLFVEENIIGAENKRLLVSFVIPIVQNPAFEEFFKLGKTPLMTRLQRLAELNLKMRGTGFQEPKRSELADTLDRIACAVAAGGKLFEAIEQKAGSPVEKANMLLRLFQAEAFTEPMLTAKAREAMLGYLGKPGFLSSYVAQTVKQSGQTNPDEAISELVGTLERIGIDRATGLNAMAA